MMLALVLTLGLTSCADSKTINGAKYEPYGLFSQDEEKVEGIHYKISGQAVFSGIVFSGLLFIPTIYTFGYNLYEPVCTEAEFQAQKAAKTVK